MYLGRLQCALSKRKHWDWTNFKKYVYEYLLFDIVRIRSIERASFFVRIQHKSFYLLRIPPSSSSDGQNVYYLLTDKDLYVIDSLMSVTSHFLEVLRQQLLLLQQFSLLSNSGPHRPTTAMMESGSAGPNPVTHWRHAHDVLHYLLMKLHVDPANNRMQFTERSYAKQVNKIRG